MAIEGIKASPGEPDQEAALATRTLAELERDVSALTADQPEASLLGWLNLSEVLLARAKHVRQAVEQIAIQWIGVRGDMHCGPIIYSVGQQKEVKCRDLLKCMESLLTACGGNLDHVCAYLRSDPFRYGACSKMLSPSEWDSAFIVNRQDKLVLKRIDTRFLKHRSEEAKEK